MTVIGDDFNKAKNCIDMIFSKNYKKGKSFSRILKN